MIMEKKNIHWMCIDEIALWNSLPFPEPPEFLKGIWKQLHKEEEEILKEEKQTKDNESEESK